MPILDTDLLLVAGATSLYMYPNDTRSALTYTGTLAATKYLVDGLRLQYTTVDAQPKPPPISLHFDSMFEHWDYDSTKVISRRKPIESGGLMYVGAESVLASLWFNSMMPPTSGNNRQWPAVAASMALVLVFYDYAFPAAGGSSSATGSGSCCRGCSRGSTTCSGAAA